MSSPEFKTHIPFRNSTLTKILRSSLGGNSKTAVVLCITPSETHFDQTLSTLRFGQLAKKIENKPVVNMTQDYTKSDLMEAELKLKKKDTELKLLKEANSDTVWRIVQDLGGKTTEDLVDMETVLMKCIARVSREIGKREGALIDI
jgi:hypothetical protein